VGAKGLIWLVPLLLFSCGSRPQSAGVYYWKTVLSWSDADTQRLEEAGVRRLGLRMFDWGAQGTEGPLVVRSPVPPSLDVVPVAYVTVDRLKAWADQKPQAAIEAGELLDRMDRVLATAWPGKPAHYQLDADWSASTRAAWFAVVAAFRDLVHSRGAKVEVTVRLHQYRDRAVQGVPPADGGVLLLYGAGDAVLDRDVVASYVKADDYPLPLVPAFPVYTQVRQLNGYGRLVALHRLGAGTELPLTDLRSTAPGTYDVLRRSELQGRPLMAHDRLLVDVVAPGVLDQVAKWPAVAALRHRAGDRLWIFDYDSEGWEALVHGPLAPNLFPR